MAPRQISPQRMASAASHVSPARRASDRMITIFSAMLETDYYSRVMAFYGPVRAMA